MQRYKYVLSAFLLTLLLAACRAATPTPAVTVVLTPTPEAAATPQASPTVVPTSAPEPTATPTPLPAAPIIQIEPTCTPGPDEGQIRVNALPIGQPGHYVNVTFGYQLRYPPSWYTGFGNRPLLVSFSNLDPGTHNRLSMRTEGCLIEVRSTINVPGLTLQSARAQIPKAFPNAEEFDLDGEPALRVRESGEGKPFESEWVFLGHEDRWFHLTLEYAPGAGEICRPAWENMLSTWQWFESDFVVYRNPNYGYAISHPRRWYRFNPRERGISISSQDPASTTDPMELPKTGVLVETDVFDNEENLPLKEWIAAQDWEVDLTNDIPLDGLVGVRVLREGPSPEIQEMSGYFQGPLGRICVVTCLYPADQQWEFRPIANAIIYSFNF